MLFYHTPTLGLHTHTEWEYKRTAASRYEQNKPPPRREDHQPAVKPFRLLHVSRRSDLDTHTLCHHSRNRSSAHMLI